jgi:hypothetical protein
MNILKNLYTFWQDKGESFLATGCNTYEKGGHWLYGTDQICNLPLKIQKDMTTRTKVIALKWLCIKTNGDTHARPIT